jgi:hypothetical protein
MTRTARAIVTTLAVVALIAALTVGFVTYQDTNNDLCPDYSPRDMMDDLCGQDQ